MSAKSHFIDICCWCSFKMSVVRGYTNNRHLRNRTIHRNKRTKIQRRKGDKWHFSNCTPFKGPVTLFFIFKEIYWSKRCLFFGIEYVISSNYTFMQAANKCCCFSRWLTNQQQNKYGRFFIIWMEFSFQLVCVRKCTIV